MKVINFFILCFVMSPIMVRAESIDCGKAKSSVERLICGNTNLSILDENLNKIYLKSLESKDIKSRVITSQRLWIKKIRNLCQDVTCIKKAYEARIIEINRMPSSGDNVIGSSLQTPENIKRTEEVNTTNSLEVTSSCEKININDALNLPASESVMQLVHISRTNLSQKNFECAVRALEQSNLKIQSLKDGTERAVLGMEIKDVVDGLFQDRDLPSHALEQRAILAAVQSLNKSDELIKESTEDERYNDASFFERLIRVDKEDKKSIFRMYKLSFSLPANRKFVEPWQNRKYMDALDADEIGLLWEMAPVGNRAELEQDIARRLGEPIRSIVSMGILHARGELANLSKLELAVEEIKAKQNSFWAWPIYRYMAEAYWNVGEKEKSKILLDRAWNSVRIAKSDSSWRTKELMGFAASLCTKVGAGGRVYERCPFGIYGTTDVDSLIEEIEALAKTSSDSKALDRAGALKKRLLLGREERDAYPDIGLCNYGSRAIFCQ